MVVLMVLATWFLGLAAFVVLKARQPKWEYPQPPLDQRPTWEHFPDAA
jgi:hypothetical protein